MGNTTKSMMLHYVRKMYIQWATPFGYMTHIEVFKIHLNKEILLRDTKTLDGKVNMIEE